MKFNFEYLFCFLVIIFSVLLISVSSVCAEDVDNQTIPAVSEFSSTNYVINQSEADSGNGAGTFDDLQVEINNAPAGSVLNLIRDYNGAYGSRIQFNKDLTIDGQGHTLDCLNTECTAFYSSSGNITLMNLKIINGHNDDNYNGGAIHIEGSAQYTIINCTLNNNWADDYGGAIYNGVNKPLTIINSTFNNNEADDESGGAIYSVGDVYLENSILNSNIAYSNGGAIFCSENVYIAHCLFELNNADGAEYTECRGGAIYCKKDLTVDNSTFKNSYAHDYGGAVYADNIYVNNNQDSNQSYNSFFISNIAGDNACGALYSCGGINVKNALFLANSGREDGGAIFCSENAYITHCLFHSNMAYGTNLHRCAGGAIFCKKDLTVDNSTFRNNFAFDYGGAVYAEHIYVNSNQDSNQSFFIDNEAGMHDGGAVYSWGASNITNAVFITNIACEYGGAIFCTRKLDIAHCLFESNKADGAFVLQCKGGAIYCKEDLTVDNSIFRNNYAGDYGGAIYADTLELKPGCIFDSNTAYENHGGAIWVNKFREDVKYVKFINNKAGAKGDGGAIYIDDENWVTFSQCEFADNRCGNQGGAIYLDSSSSHLILSNNIFVSNSAKEGQTVYNCGKFDSINNNWWGGKNPSSGNDQLVEWKMWSWSNIYYSDSNPLKFPLIYF